MYVSIQRKYAYMCMYMKMLIKYIKKLQKNKKQHFFFRKRLCTIWPEVQLFTIHTVHSILLLAVEIFSWFLFGLSWPC